MIPKALAVSCRVSASRNSLLFVGMVVLLEYSFACFKSLDTFRDNMDDTYRTSLEIVFPNGNRSLRGMRFTTAHGKIVRPTPNSH